MLIGGQKYYKVRKISDNEFFRLKQVCNPSELGVLNSFQKFQEINYKLTTKQFTYFVQIKSKYESIEGEQLKRAPMPRLGSNIKQRKLYNLPNNQALWPKGKKK